MTKLSNHFKGYCFSAFRGLAADMETFFVSNDDSEHLDLEASTPNRVHPTYGIGCYTMRLTLVKKSEEVYASSYFLAKSGERFEELCGETGNFDQATQFLRSLLDKQWDGVSFNTLKKS